MTPQTPPTDRPLTAGDAPLTEQCRVVVHFANGIASVFSDYAKLAATGVHSTLYPIWLARSADLIETLGNILNDMDAVTDEDDWTAPIVRASAQYQSRPATSAASEGLGVLERAKLASIVHMLSGMEPSNTVQIYGREAAIILAALASPPVSERERELEGALRNLLGAFDTPIARRRLPPTDFSRAAIDQARALTAQPAGESTHG